MNFITKLPNLFEFKIVQWNCFKMTQARLLEFNLFLDQFQPDLVSIQEIKMNQEQANLFLRFDGYKVYYKPRINGNPECGGGTAIIAKETIYHCELLALIRTWITLGSRLKQMIFVLTFSHFIPLLIHLKKK